MRLIGLVQGKLHPLCVLAQRASIPRLESASSHVPVVWRETRPVRNPLGRRRRPLDCAMSLSAGSRLGPYEIQAPLGAGGMGEVYRARDTRLKREVALKILPDSFAGDAGRLARFQREAEVLAALNHPYIAAIYGIEEAGPSPGSAQAAVRALVLELVEGETLADRIAHGAIPLEDALPIARQIA